MPARRTAAGLFAVMLLLALPAPAHADKDFCISASGAVVFAAKKFRLPKKRQCVPVHGYCPLCSTTNALAGSACTSDDGSKMILALTMMLHDTNNARSLVSIQLNPATLEGTWRELWLDGNGNLEFGPLDITAAACTAPPMP